MLKKPFLLSLNLQLFSADGVGGGGGYDLSQEQFDGLDLDFGEGGYQTETHEPEENEAPDNSGIETPGEGGEQTQMPQSFNIPGIGEVSIDEINEWRGGGLRQSDYTRKTQELAEQRKQMEEEFGAYRQLDQLFQANPNLEQQFIQMLQQQDQLGGANPQQEQSQQFDPTQHPMFQQMNQQLQQQQQMFQQWQEQQMRAQIDNEWNGLFSKYPDAQQNKDALAKFVDDYNEKHGASIGLEAGYMLMNFDNVKKNTQQEMVKNNMKKKPANTVKPQNNASTEPAEPSIPAGNYEALVRHLMKKDINL